MAKKEEPEQEQPTELEKQVDAMMDPSRPDDTQTAPEIGDESGERLLVIDDSNTNAPALPEESVEEPVTSDENVAAETPPDNPLDGEETDSAVDDINREDSDKLLAVDGGSRGGNGGKAPKKPGVFKRWWRNKPARWSTIIIILILIAAALATPVSRFWIFNHVGLRARISAQIIDGSSKLPIANARVTIDGQTQITGADGKVNLPEVELGPQQLTVKKPAFASVKRDVTVTLGDKNLGKISLKPVGLQYLFKLTNYLSGQPVIGANVSFGSASAESDTSGVARLTLMGEQKDDFTVKVKANGYNTKTVKVNGGSYKKANKVSLTPTGKDYFISKKNGDYSVYSANLDGSGRDLLLAGTGLENPNLQLAANESGDLLALVSVRDNKEDKGGHSLQSLTIINTKSGHPLSLDHGKSIHLVGWLDGSTLVYVASHDCSGGACSQLMSYDYDKGARKELASSGSFTSVITISDRIYYATGTDYQSSDKAKFVAVNSDGTNQDVILNQDIYSVVRPSYDELYLAAAGQWYSYKAGDKSAEKVSAPSNPASSRYVDSPSGQKSAWIDRRDGKSVLLVYNKSNGNSQQVTSQPGLTYPIRWVGNDTLIYRVDSSNETADYVLDLSNGKSHKIVNVTDAEGARPLRS